MNLARWTLLTFMFFGGQASSSQPQVTTCHIRGTITGLDVPVAPIEVIFRNETSSKTVVSNAEGFYEADLPLGRYLMTVQQGPSGSRRWHERPLLRVTSGKTIILDIYFGCPRSQQFFSLPAADGTPFRLAVQFNDYWWGLTGAHGYNVGYHRGDPVLVEYNLSTVRADHVIYHKRQRTTENGSLTEIKHR